MDPTKPLEKIAIIGATGHIGEVFVAALLKTGKHSITALTRAESKRILPEGVKRAQVDYDNQESLVAALQGQQFLIITLAVRAPPDTHGKIIQAAAKAGVPYVMPNFYGSDIRNPKLGDDKFGAIIKQQVSEMENLGVSYISLACGTWYEWSLALGEKWFGFTIPERKVTFFDDGKTVVNVSTWSLCGRAIAALLSLPESGASPALSDWKNEPLYIASFQVSQRDMLDSLHRVLGTTDSDWDIKYESTAKRAQEGMGEFSRGIRTGIAKYMYAKLFISSRAGEFDNPKGVANKVLGLPEESLDEATGRAVHMVESGWNPLAPP
ncbi:hypothetical protein F5B20DRAFT_217916 [Whalleya microplaca]|nr:hypothetical protein F5B20DRAFT_217916 [Whalleya microplaca]